MNGQKIEPTILARAEQWLGPDFDTETRDEVKHLIENNPKELTDAFYRSLEFGTGGLRGIMGAGTNRMNIYTVGMATQGLANYLLAQFAHINEIRVAIATDSRNNSTLFAETAAKILSANGIVVYLFESLRPTPELSFAVRSFRCQSGIVVTASHNPEEYNGYKVYWEDGGQTVPPHDKNIIAEVNRIESVREVKFEGNPALIRTIGRETDEMYLNTLTSLSLSPEINRKHSNLKIVYTALHGTGVVLVPQALRKFGFDNVTTVKEQDVSDGNFPTVVSPNPEEASALKMALELADRIGADLVMATDPDSDRVGLGVRSDKGKLVLLNGNQAATLLIFYLLTKWKEKGMLKGKEYIVKTIVTTDLLSRVAQHFGVECHEVLTGFKYIAEIIRQLEDEKTFIGGGEESYGYLVGSHVRDKDAVLSCAMFAEIAAWAQEQNRSLYQLLIEIYVKFGLYKEHLISLTKKGKDGAEEIKTMMQAYRGNPPTNLGGSRVIQLLDYEAGTATNLKTKESSHLNFPKSNVIQFITEDGTRVSVRPSGTEPKIKFYFGVRGDLNSYSEYEQTAAKLDAKIQTIIDELVKT